MITLTRENIELKQKEKVDEINAVYKEDLVVKEQLKENTDANRILQEKIKKIKELNK